MIKRRRVTVSFAVIFILLATLSAFFLLSQGDQVMDGVAVLQAKCYVRILDALGADTTQARADLASKIVMTHTKGAVRDVMENLEDIVGENENIVTGYNLFVTKTIFSKADAKFNRFLDAVGGRGISQTVRILVKLSVVAALIVLTAIFVLVFSRMFR